MKPQQWQSGMGAMGSDGQLGGGPVGWSLQLTVFFILRTSSASIGRNTSHWHSCI